MRFQRHQVTMFTQLFPQLVRCMTLSPAWCHRLDGAVIILQRVRR